MDEPTALDRAFLCESKQLSAAGVHRAHGMATRRQEQEGITRRDKRTGGGKGARREKGVWGEGGARVGKARGGGGGAKEDRGGRCDHCSLFSGRFGC